MLTAPTSLGIIFFPAYDWAISPTHPERQERLLYTQDQLREEGVFDIPGVTELKPDLATAEDVARVHFCFPDVPAVTTTSSAVVTRRLTQAGSLMSRKPSMTIWPAMVAVTVEFRPQQSSAMAKSVGAIDRPSSGAPSRR